MKDLKTLREVGEAMNREECELPLDLTIEQSVKVFASLYETVRHQLAETLELFRPVREAELIEFQATLRRLDEWRQQHAQTQCFPEMLHGRPVRHAHDVALRLD